MITHILTHRDFAGCLLNQYQLLGEAVEIGTFMGEYAEQLLLRWKGKMLHMVDPFVKQPFETYTDGCNTSDFDFIFKEWEKRMERFKDRITLHKMFSHEAVVKFKDQSLDFVYVDGNHMYEPVKQDINLWWPKIKSGGLMAGHDYYDKNDADFICGVKRAVDEFCQTNLLPMTITEGGYYGDCRSWWVTKP